ncbi:MAG: hypothetical protein ACTS22_01020 [Phycisphaerales bacterium]
MTSQQSMLFPFAALLAGAVLLLAGCQSPSLTPPTRLTSPYDSSRGEVLWAVAPLTNESGTSLVPTDELTDAIVRACQQIEGVRCLPQNRVIAEMRGLGIRAIASPADAQRLAERLGVNGLIIGTITDYHPYEPPKLGLALALETSGPAPFVGDDLSLETLRGSTGERVTEQPGTARYTQVPAASLAVVFDGRHHDTLMELQRFAEGRHDPDAARGWRVYLASMPLFTEFAAQAAVSRLLDEERLRLARARAAGRMSSR